MLDKLYTSGCLGNLNGVQEFVREWKVHACKYLVKVGKALIFIDTIDISDISK